MQGEVQDAHGQPVGLTLLVAGVVHAQAVDDRHTEQGDDGAHVGHGADSHVAPVAIVIVVFFVTVCQAAEHVCPEQGALCPLCGSAHVGHLVVVEVVAYLAGQYGGQFGFGVERAEQPCADDDVSAGQHERSGLGRLDDEGVQVAVAVGGDVCATQLGQHALHVGGDVGIFVGNLVQVFKVFLAFGLHFLAQVVGLFLFGLSLIEVVGQVSQLPEFGQAFGLGPLYVAKVGFRYQGLLSFQVGQIVDAAGVLLRLADFHDQLDVDGRSLVGLAVVFLQRTFHADVLGDGVLLGQCGTCAENGHEADGENAFHILRRSKI